MEFEKYTKLKRLGDDENRDIFLQPDDEIIVQEKIDGGNFRFYVSETGKLIFGSRTQQLTSNEGEDTNVAKNFKRCVEFIREQVKGKDMSKYCGLIFYGECCVKHTISYNWDAIPPFLGFDILRGGEYVAYDEAKEIFEELELPMVPLVGRWNSKEITLPITDSFVPASQYALESAKDMKGEGVVFKNYKRQIFAKYVRDEFKERNAEAFGGSPKYNKIDDTDDSEFIFKYVTNQRIEKLILKEIDKGEKLSMSLMGNLIRSTYLDIIEEEWREILTSNWKLDFKNIRKRLAPRVKAVLEQMIENNYILKEDNTHTGRGFVEQNEKRSV